ncbi:MAG TPA: GNAT family N-acetyltransferase [Pyrinomonadaceae bacterium]|nr:GNAT family N-acetyltransferase [Pyrinomonadaceae bacterium]
MKWKLLNWPLDNEARELWTDFLVAAQMPTQYGSEHFFIDPFVRGGERFAIAAMDDAEKIAALSTGVQKNGVVTCGLPSRPQLFFREGVDRQAALTCVFEGIVEAWNPKFIQLVSWGDIDGAESLGFERMTDSGNNEVVLLDLSLGYEKLFKNFSSARRNGIRKAERFGVEIMRLADDRDIDALYEIHVQWNRRKGNEPDDIESFRRGARQTDSRAVFIAKYEGKVIAGSYFRFVKGGVMEYAGNNSFEEHQHLKPNELLLSHGIKWASTQYIKTFSLGGAHPFLQRFGGEVVRTSVYTSDRTFLRLHRRREDLQNLRGKFIQLVGEKNKKRIARLVGRTA